MVSKKGIGFLMFRVPKRCVYGGIKMAEDIFSSIGVENFGGNEFVCDCGHSHKISTEKIFFSNNACERFITYFKKKYGYMRVLIMVREECYIDSAKRLQNDFIKHGYYVQTHVFATDSEMDVSNFGKLYDLYEQEQLIVAVGENDVNDFVRCYAKRYDLVCATHCLSMNSCTYLSENAFVKNKGSLEKVKAKATRFLMIDFMEYEIISKRNVALAFQTTMCQMLNTFNWLFEKSFKETDYCREVSKMIFSCVSKSIDACEGARDKVNSDCLMVCEQALRVNIAIALMEDMGHCEVLTNDVLFMLALIRNYNNKNFDLLRESELLVSLLITDIYDLYLSKQIIDVSVPSGRNERANILCKLMNKKLLRVMLSMNKSLTEQEYEIMQYKMSEYRDDFAIRAKNVAKLLHNSFSQYKRVYFDTGYFLHRAIDYDEFMLAINLVNDLSSHYSLLRYIVETGILEKYVNEKCLA